LLESRFLPILDIASDQGSNLIMKFQATLQTSTDYALKITETLQRNSFGCRSGSIYYAFKNQVEKSWEPQAG
jgi:hypothetical protein